MITPQGKPVRKVTRRTTGILEERERERERVRERHREGEREREYGWLQSGC